MVPHTAALQYAPAPLNNNPAACIPRDDIDRHLAYDDIEDTSGRSTFIPLTLPEPQGVYPHPQFKPITPSRVLKWPMYDPFVGAAEAKPSPIFTPRQSTQEKETQVAYRQEPHSPSPTPLKSVKPLTSSRVAKSICRVLFPSSHRQTHGPSLSAQEPAKDFSTNTDSTGIADVQCCAGCYGTYVSSIIFPLSIDNADTWTGRRVYHRGYLCDKSGKADCSQCMHDGKAMCRWVTLAEKKRLDRC